MNNQVWNYYIRSCEIENLVIFFWEIVVPENCHRIELPNIVTVLKQGNKNCKISQFGIQWFDYIKFECLENIWSLAISNISSL